MQTQFMQLQRPKVYFSLYIIRKGNNILKHDFWLALPCRDITYSYHVKRIPYADYRVNQIIPVITEKDFTDSSHVAHQENRLLRKRYGIKIEFHQSGRLGEETNVS